MWAIYHKEQDGLAWRNDSTQFLIFTSKAEAWSCLLNEIGPQVQDIYNYDVIQIRWTKT